MSIFYAKFTARKNIVQFVFTHDPLQYLLQKYYCIRITKKKKKKTFLSKYYKKELCILVRLFIDGL